MKITSTANHVDWNPYRKRRNMLLNQSDKYMLPDFPIAEDDRALVEKYRQNLRTMFDGLTHPEQAEFPEWPI